MLFLLAAPTAGATADYQAPEAVFLISGSTFSSGQSNNLGPTARQVLNEFWIPGACPSSTDPTDGSHCDPLRLGLTLYAAEDCATAARPVVTPAEDGGAHVDDALKGMQNQAGTYYCATTTYRPLDDALWQHHAITFPGGAGASDATKDRWYERPHLTLAIIDDLPQTSDTAHDNRVKGSLQAACALHQGDVANGVPSMPTWVMFARKIAVRAEPFARLLAAAGGTATCCYGTACDPIADAIDVCAHTAGRTEGQLRNDLELGRYRCAPGERTFSTGAMDFEGNSSFGTLPEIRCHLVGESFGDNCHAAGRQATNVLGMFTCVRQLPRGVTADDVSIWYCPDDAVGCERLTEDNGGIEFIDAARTLYLVTGHDEAGRSRCDMLFSGGGDIDVRSCLHTGEACTVPGQHGRCAIGVYECRDGQDTCVSRFEPMPEVCNGLDNDCDGRIDNLSSSLVPLPDAYRSLACFGRDACVCPNGPEEHTGDTLQSYLDAWQGLCHCSDALGESDGPLSFEAGSIDGAACALSSPAERRAAGVGLILCGLLLLAACVRFRHLIADADAA